MVMTKEEFFAKFLEETPSEDFFDSILKSEYGFSGRRNNRGYDEAIQYKIKKIMKPLFKKNVAVHAIPEINELEYSIYMLDVLKEYLNGRSDHLFLSKRITKEEHDDIKLRIKFLDQIEPEEINNNRLNKTLNFIDSSFPKGMKAIRVINKISLNKEEYQNSITEKIAGALKLNPKDKKGIYLSIKPEAMIYAGVSGDSCLSPEGENEDSLLLYPVTSYVALLHSEDFSWRAWLLIDVQSKSYSILKGYPFENFYAQVAAHTFMKSFGYNQVHSYSFRLGPDYIESTAGFAGLLFTGSSPVDNVIKDKAFMKHDIYTGKRIRNSNLLNAQAARCDYCEKISWGVDKNYLDNGLCEYCNEFKKEHLHLGRL